MLFRRPRTRRTRLMFVTGGSGYLGRHLLEGPAGDEWEMVALPSHTLDLRLRDRVVESMRDWRPGVVVHLAYRKGNRSEIVDTSANVAQAARSVGARLVHMSSDLVFPGRMSAYREHDVARPNTEYGQHKLAAEERVTAIDPGAAIVRTSLLYGTERPSPVQRDVLDVVEGRDRMAFFTDEYRCPSHVEDVAAALSKIAAMPEITGVLHVAGPTVVSRADLALWTARHYGLDDSLVPLTTIAESGLTRPEHIVLDSSRAAQMGIAVRPFPKLDRIVATTPGPG